MQLMSLQADAVVAQSLAWSPDGQYLTCVGGGLMRWVQVWDVTRARLVSHYRGHLSLVHSVAWSPDGKRLASGGWGTDVPVTDALSGQWLFFCAGGRSQINGVAWSPDGRYIAAAETSPG
jgi:WD40 repeat protein